MATQGQVDANLLLQGARCFKCLPPQILLAVQTYIIAVGAGLGTNPNELARLSKDMQRLSGGTLLDIKAYILAVIAGFPTDPNSLADRALCYLCIPDGMMPEVQTWLFSLDPGGPGSSDPNTLAGLARGFQDMEPSTLLQIQVYLLARVAGLSTDPNALADLAKCMTCLPFPVLTSVVTQTLNFLEDATGDTGGGGGIFTPPCDPNTAPVISGEVYGTNPLGNTNVLITFTATACVCSQGNAEWVLYGSNNPDGSSATEVTTYAVAGSAGSLVAEVVAIPLPLPDFLYFYVTMRCTGFETTPSNVVPLGDPDVGEGVANDWADRVEINGGARPSTNSIDAAATFWTSILAKQFDSKILALNMVAPDNLIASITPLIVGAGNDPWTNNGPFVAGDLSVNGLKGNAATKWLNTGINPTTAWADNTTGGLSAYCYDAWTNVNMAAMGCSTSATTNQLALIYSNTNSLAEWRCNLDNGASRATSAYHRMPGFFSGNRLAAGDSKLYFGNFHYGFFQAGTSAASAGTRPNTIISAFASRDSAGVLSLLSDRRMSFFAIHDPLTSTEAEDLYGFVHTLRSSFGGGIVPDPSNTVEVVADWQARITDAGGAAVAPATVTAVTDFWNAIIAANLESKMMEASCFVPDNLIAAITPLYRSTGFPSYSNTGFVVGDLTVNGLLGAAGKRLRNFSVPIGATRSLTSIGLTAYLFTNTNSGQCVVGSTDGVNQLALQPFNSNMLWDSWNFTVGAGRASWANLWTGYLSGNRIAANDSKIYRAKSTQAHGSVASIVTSGGSFPNTEIVFFAVNVAGASTHVNRVSFIGVHDGLTEAESSDFFDAIQALRTALGGGFL